VITLRDVEGYDTKEACSVLDISPGSSGCCCIAPALPSEHRWKTTSPPRPSVG
jgi:hypothetical protein